MTFVQMRPESWTSQGTRSCSPRKSVCHHWTPADGTHTTGYRAVKVS